MAICEACSRPNSNGDCEEPIGLADLTQVLSRRYGLDLQDQLGAALW